MKVKSESEVAQSCPTLCARMDCSLPGSSVNGIFQARVLEWGALAYWHLWLDLANRRCWQEIAVQEESAADVFLPQKTLAKVYYVFVREGNGTPLQYSCLENPIDGGAW